MMKTIKIYLFIAFLPFICKGQNISILDENTSEKFNFQAVEFWHDGSKMNDDKIDNVIYLKNNGLYYKTTKGTKELLLNKDGTFYI